MSPRLAAAALLALAAAALAGCSSTVSLQPAPSAGDPGCAEVMARLPDSVGGEPRRWTDAQSTAAWGEPAAVILTCGLPELGPTDLPCRTVADVDWVIDESDAPRYRVTSFNRTPAVEVYLDNEVVSSADVLGVLSSRVSVLPSNDRACTSVEETG